MISVGKRRINLQYDGNNVKMVQERMEIFEKLFLPVWIGKGIYVFTTFKPD